jgi:hypothetical protein
MFHREGLSAPRPTPKLEDHPLSAVHDCLFNLFAATLHIGGRSSIRNLRTRHAVVTGTHYTWEHIILLAVSPNRNPILLQFLHHLRTHLLSFSVRFRHWPQRFAVAVSSATWKTQSRLRGIVAELSEMCRSVSSSVFGFIWQTSSLPQLQEKSHSIR